MNTMQNRTQPSRSQTSSTFEDWAATPKELLQEYPMSSTLIAFGLGLGVGVIVGHSVSAALMPERSHRTNMESFGRQVCDALRTSLPDSISRHLPV